MNSTERTIPVIILVAFLLGVLGLVISPRKLETKPELAKAPQMERRASSLLGGGVDYFQLEVGRKFSYDLSFPAGAPTPLWYQEPVTPKMGADGKLKLVLSIVKAAEPTSYRSGDPLPLDTYTVRIDRDDCNLYRGTTEFIWTVQPGSKPGEAVVIETAAFKQVDGSVKKMSRPAFVSAQRSANFKVEETGETISFVELDSSLGITAMRLHRANSRGLSEELWYSQDIPRGLDKLVQRINGEVTMTWTRNRREVSPAR